MLQVLHGYIGYTGSHSTWYWGRVSDELLLKPLEEKWMLFLLEGDIRIIKPTKLNPLEANVQSFVLRKTKIFLQKCQNNETEAFCLKFTCTKKDA